MTAFPYTPEVREDWPDAFKTKEFWDGWRRDLEKERAIPRAKRVEWNQHNLCLLANGLFTNMGYDKIARIIGCSEIAVYSAINNFNGREEIIAKYR